MAAVSLFWDTNMAAETSYENTLWPEIYTKRKHWVQIAKLKHCAYAYNSIKVKHAGGGGRSGRGYSRF